MQEPELVILYESHSKRYAIAVQQGADRIVMRHELHHQDAIQIANGIRSWSGLTIRDRTPL